MAPYALFLNGDHYLILLDNVVVGSDAHNALLGAQRPTPSNHRGIVCSEKAARELLLLAQTTCPEAAGKISTQLSRQKAL